MKGLQRIGCILMLVSSSATAMADDGAPAPDEITLKSGETIRGRVLTVERGSKVVLVDEAGNERTLTWADVADVERGKHTAKRKSRALPTPGPEGPGYDEPLPEEDEYEEATSDVDERAPVDHELTVQVRSNVPVDLVQRVGRERGVGSVTERTKPTTVCRAPCEATIDPREGSLIVTGDGIIPSPGFVLDRYDESATVYVDTGFKARRQAGLGIMIAGGVGTLVGGTWLTVALIADQPDEMKIAGAAVGGASLPALVTGIALFAGTRTTVEILPGKSRPPERHDKDEETAMFELDRRPSPIEPRYWLGEF
ncbi:MAG: hypothetical protein HOW73_41485 [Polyangiaceae bacterium]|nr:hypothetical protein [Polyangiaceae bacterium]